MFKIIAKAVRGRHRGRHREIVDKAETIEEANEWLPQYQMAFGQNWNVSILPTGEERRLQEVAALRKTELSNSQIAAHLGMTTDRVTQLANKLTRLGRIEKRAPGQKRTATERNEMIAKLRESGAGPLQIAQQLKMKHTTVRAIIHNLRVAGRLPRIK